MTKLKKTNLPNEATSDTVVNYRPSLSSPTRQAAMRPSSLVVLFALSSSMFAISLSAVCATQPNQTTPETGVTDLQLESDFRAAKLRWTYKHSEANEPASFLISYCELTSWDVEIKCRQRHLRVDDRQQPVILRTPEPELARKLPGDAYEAHVYDLRALTNYTFRVQVAQFAGQEPIAPASLTQTAGARQAQKAARRLSLAKHANGLPDRVETKPFRAEATKCLADVSEVVVNTGRYFGGRISVENSADPRCNLLGNKSSEQSSYLFRIDHEACNSKIVDGNRIETMVLVHENKDILTHNTARFLVLCNFLQKSFTLRASISLPKVNGLLGGGGGGAIGAHSATRQATITSLSRRPTQQELSEESHNSVPVMLGSMPGFFLAKPTNASSTGQPEQSAETASNVSQKPPRQQEPDKISDSAAEQKHAGRRSELETNIIETFDNNNNGNNNRNPRLLQQQLLGKRQQSLRQVKASEAEAATETETPASTTPQPQPQSQAAATARSLTLLTRERISNGADHQQGHNGQQRHFFSPPSPVEVQSKVLYVIRGDPVSGNPAMAAVISANAPESSQPLAGRRAAGHTKQQPTLAKNLADEARTHSQTNEITAMPAVTMKQKTMGDNNKTTPAVDTKPADLTNPDLSHLAITLTNNHRVSADYLPVAQVAASSRPQSASTVAGDSYDFGGFSIKYSAAGVNEYSVGANEEPARFSSLQSRSRSGRMRSIQATSTESEQIPMITDAVATNEAGHSQRGQANSFRAQESDHKMSWNAINRMGEMQADGDLSMGADSSSETARVITEPNNSTWPAQSAPQSLAHNITSYLLRWSLKTLSSLARKSLESLAQDEGGTTTSDVAAARQVPGETAERQYPQAARELPPTTPARRQVVLTTTTATTTTTTTTTTTSTTPRPRTSEPDFALTDGFLTSKRRVGDQPAGGGTRAVARRPHPARRQPEQTRSTDGLQRIETEPSIEANNPRQLRPPPTYEPAADQTQGAHPSPARTSSLLGWFVSSLTLAVCLLSLVFVIVWLVFSPVKLSARSLGGNSSLENPLQRNADLDSNSLHQSTPPPQPQLATIGARNGATMASGSYQKYDFTSNKFHAPISPLSGLLSSPKSGGFNDATMNTRSNMSTISRVENDCKNSELVYTERVLLNSGNNSLDESFA